MNIPSKSAQFAKSVEVSGQPFDLEEVRRFLRMLAPEETQLQFQTSDDNRDRSARRTNLSRTAFGTFDEHLAWLTEANQRNAAVCVTVNKTLGGRAKHNVTAVRALMLDLDGAPLGPVQACKLRPHVITETSPGHYHAFWRLDGLPIDSFKSCSNSGWLNGSTEIRASPPWSVARACLDFSTARTPMLLSLFALSRAMTTQPIPQIRSWLNFRLAVGHTSNRRVGWYCLLELRSKQQKHLSTPTFSKVRHGF
jgi:hypothetical protein